MFAQALVTIIIVIVLAIALWYVLGRPLYNYIVNKALPATVSELDEEIERLMAKRDELEEQEHTVGVLEEITEINDNLKRVRKKKLSLQSRIKKQEQS